jgi:hypothetical protein
MVRIYTIETGGAPSLQASWDEVEPGGILFSIYRNFY